ncbi:MAG: metallophosphoesterase [Cyanobacteria bacterium P01_A01_bin.114]
MQFASDPSTTVKIDRMKQRVRWQHPEFLEREIDQTRLVLDVESAEGDDAEAFSFLVIGDSGTGTHRGDNPQRRVAEWLMANGDGCRFVLHTGDLVYLVGSQDQYPSNFIEPYREWLVGGETPSQIAYNNMVFKLPFLPVPGNHDYYDIPLGYGALSKLLSPLKYLLRHQIDLDYGWRGSYQGDVYARAFLDYTKGYAPGQLETHLAQHYTAQTDTGYCLRYQPQKFTRLPNRYYTFRQGGIDFFALDSNTFNSPVPLSKNPAGKAQRRQLIDYQQKLLSQKQQQLDKLPVGVTDENIDDIYVKIEEIDEQLRDVNMRLSQQSEMLDYEQLDWLKLRLTQSWQTEGVRGRVIYFHHPPYVTEASKWHQGQTLAVRQCLRQVLDDVQRSVGERAGGRPIVDLIINGHAHCFEYIQTLDTGHADAHTHCLVCGGSGFSLRRQRTEGSTLTETIDGREREVARSHQFIGRNGHGSQKRRPYSGLKIEVQPGSPPRFTVRPYVVEKYQHRWQTHEMPPIEIAPGGSLPADIEPSHLSA